MNELNMLSVVEDSFEVYAGMTIQDRAIVDARDCLKPSHRMCMYSLLLHKYTYDKPYVKSNECVGIAQADFYVHGDAACYDLMARLAKVYSMRYPLMKFKGQYGNLDNGKPSGSRYTEMKLGELGCKLYEGIDEDSIDVWFDNYSGTKQFPGVVPSLGFYNIVNGTSGIATALASSVPQFNLREVNEAMIKLLWNPDIDFDEIYCAPDFATGGTILNADCVKEILRYGGGEAVKGMKKNGKKLGSSVRMRASVEFNSEENALYFTEIPYGVYTGTIIDQIVKGINEGEIVGIAHQGLRDLSKHESNIKVILEKGVNPTKMIKTLFKKTDLDSCYSINMIMLDHGTFPKLFTWKEALQAHLDHEIETRIKIHQYYIKKIKHRIHIIDGLLIAIGNIDRVIEVIRGSKDKADAKVNLMNEFPLDGEQTDAILKLSLSKLTHLESSAYVDEKGKLTEELAGHEEPLNNRDKLYEEIENDLRKVANEYGDDRRTRLMNFDFAGEEEDAEPIEKKELLIHYTNLGNIYTQTSSTLVTHKRGGAGSKLKLKDNEIIVQTLSDDNFSSLLVFSNLGQMYTYRIDALPVDAKINASQLFDFKPGERITKITSLSRRQTIDYFVFVTKNGMIKKTASEEYNIKRGKSVKAINLKDGDEVVAVHFIKNEPVGILTSQGNFVIISTEEINAIGRATAGVKAIKLGDDDEVIASHIVTGDFLITTTTSGLIKKASLEEFPISNRGIKGKKISGVRDEDSVVNFLTLEKDCDIIVISNKGLLKFNTSDLRVLSREATGVKAMKLPEGIRVVDLIKV